MPTVGSPSNGEVLGAGLSVEHDKTAEVAPQADEFEKNLVGSPARLFLSSVVPHHCSPAQRLEKLSA